MQKILIIGYGNPDREDDGVAWHILQLLAVHYNIKVPDNYLEGFYPEEKSIDLYSTLQLTPEMADTIANYDAVCFVDAHTGAVPEEINIKQLEPGFQQNPFTHHMTPETCLSITQTLYKKTPVALLVSVRGYSFQFSHDLSPVTRQLSEKAAAKISEWVDKLSKI
jgi:hydrogenase maturation protease